MLNSKNSFIFKVYGTVLRIQIRNPVRFLNLWIRISDKIFRFPVLEFGTSFLLTLSSDSFFYY
jgi:hypothetical protein